jgi:predicted O-methyltransferase YrrM
MIRHFKPKQIIEIGSGFSSALTLDTNSSFFNNEIKLTFIEPYPERLYSLISDSDKKSTTIIESDVQLISLEVFEKLNSGDILFVDSTHVAKTGSDVNYILFEILPRLKSGVLIHFHDIFFPFEYPKEWVFKGMNWNEDYFLKAFLMYNNNFEIKFFSNYLHLHHKQAFDSMPLCYKNSGGSLWIEKK